MLPAIYSQADVFVLPSLVEGFPMTGLEAMASGLPAIVSENTFGGDVIDDGENGYVIPIRDAGAIADRLARLAAQPDLRHRMGVAARRRAEYFTWARFGTQLTEELVSLVGAGVQS